MLLFFLPFRSWLGRLLRLLRFTCFLLLSLRSRSFRLFLLFVLFDWLLFLGLRFFLHHLIFCGLMLLFLFLLRLRALLCSFLALSASATLAFGIRGRRDGFFGLLGSLTRRSSSCRSHCGR